MLPDWIYGFEQINYHQFPGISTIHENYCLTISIYRRTISIYWLTISVNWNCEASNLWDGKLKLWDSSNFWTVNWNCETVISETVNWNCETVISETVNWNCEMVNWNDETVDHRLCLVQCNNVRRLCGKLKSGKASPLCRRNRWDSNMSFNFPCPNILFANT